MVGTIVECKLSQFFFFSKGFQLLIATVYKCATQQRPLFIPQPGP